MQEFRNEDMQECRNIGMQECRNGVQPINRWSFKSLWWKLCHSVMGHFGSASHTGQSRRETVRRDRESRQLSLSHLICPPSCVQGGDARQQTGLGADCHRTVRRMVLTAITSEETSLLRIVNIQPTPVQWAVRKGGGLTYGDNLNSSGNDNNAFVCCVGHIWYDTWRHSIQCK